GPQHARQARQARGRRARQARRGRRTRLAAPPALERPCRYPREKTDKSVAQPHRAGLRSISPKTSEPPFASWFNTMSADFWLHGLGTQSLPPPQLRQLIA